MVQYICGIVQETFHTSKRKQCGNCTRYLQDQRFDMGVRIGLYKRNIEDK